jgi:hypothetical protein
MASIWSAASIRVFSEAKLRNKSRPADRKACGSRFSADNALAVMAAPSRNRTK